MDLSMKGEGTSISVCCLGLQQCASQMKLQLGKAVIDLDMRSHAILTLAVLMRQLLKISRGHQIIAWNSAILCENDRNVSVILQNGKKKKDVEWVLLRHA
jgi:hypothetical protein